MTKKEVRPLVNETDREALRVYLTKRLKATRRAIRRAQDREEEAYHQGAEMEILFAFDDLLTEEPPDLRKKPKPQ